MTKNRVSPRTLSIAFIAALGLTVVTPTQAATVAACEHDSGLCLEAVAGAKWQANRSSNKKQRKKRSNKHSGTISLEVEGGRGSLFINGRYAGTAPLSDAKIPGGANDIQVRDGAKVLAQGLLTVPRDGSVSITVAGS